MSDTYPSESRPPHLQSVNKYDREGFKNQSYSIDMHYSLSSTHREVLDIGEYRRVYGWFLMRNQSPIPS